MKHVAIALLGCGTVGKGVVDLLSRNGQLIEEQLETHISIKRILIRDLPKYEQMDLPDTIALTTDFNDIINDDEIEIVVEVMGSADFAKECIEQCFKRGKSVVSANKDLIADYGIPLLKLSQENNVDFQFEASVAGGIPVIRPMYSSLNSNRIERIIGIMNGTTNYILTKMAQEGSDFADVLKEAQELGYAEKDPTADVEGYDACRKIAILTSLAYGQQVDYEDIYTEGITKITAEDFKYAKALGAAIKIFGTSRKEGNKLYAMVAPQMIQADNPLYAVNDVFNAICVTGNMLGDVMFYGKGAGKEATASAVVSDVVDAVKHMNVNVMTIWEDEKQEVAPMDEMKNRFFVRIGASEKAKAEDLFEEVTPVDGGIADEFGFLTGTMTEKEFNETISQFDTFITRIRVGF